MNRKGLSLSGTTEAIIGIILMLSCIGIIIIGMNQKYSQSYNPTFGLATNDTLTSLNAYPGSLQQGASTDPSNNANGGVNLLGAWGMVFAGVNLAWQFINGQFIRNAVGLLHLGTAGDLLGWALTLLYFIGIGYVIIKLIFKVKP